MKGALDFNTEAFPLVTQIEMWKCSRSAPEVRPGRHPVPAAAGFSQLSRFWWDEPLQANSPGEAGSAEPSHSPAAAGHDRAWDTTSQLTQHQPYLKVGATKLKILHLEQEGCCMISFFEAILQLATTTSWLYDIWTQLQNQQGNKITVCIAVSRVRWGLWHHGQSSEIQTLSEKYLIKQKEKEKGGYA